MADMNEEFLIDQILKPGRLYFMEDFTNEDGDYAELYDLTALGKEKAVKLLEKALNEDKEARKAS